MNGAASTPTPYGVASTREPGSAGRREGAPRGRRHAREQAEARQGPLAQVRAQDQEHHGVLDPVQVHPGERERRQREQTAPRLEDEQECRDREVREVPGPQHGEPPDQEQRGCREHDRSPAPALAALAGPQGREDQRVGRERRQRAQLDQAEIAPRRVDAVEDDLREPGVVEPGGGRADEGEERRLRQRAVRRDEAAGVQVEPEVGVRRDDRPRHEPDRQGGAEQTDVDEREPWHRGRLPDADEGAASSPSPRPSPTRRSRGTAPGPRRSSARTAPRRAARAP